MGIFSNLTGWHFLILLVIVLLVFGATRLPALARSLGQSTKILRDELKDGAKGDETTSTTTTTSTSHSEPAAKSEATASTPSSGADKTS